MEMESLGKRYKACEQVFSEKMLQLTVLRRYAMRLLDKQESDPVPEFRHAEIPTELAAIVASETVC